MHFAGLSLGFLLLIPARELPAQFAPATGVVEGDARGVPVLSGLWRGTVIRCVGGPSCFSLT
jgi:hypothetical protein